MSKSLIRIAYSKTKSQGTPAKCIVSLLVIKADPPHSRQPSKNFDPGMKGAFHFKVVELPLAARFIDVSEGLEGSLSCFGADLDSPSLRSLTLLIGPIAIAERVRGAGAARDIDQ